jgi:hypothetical protein
MIGLRQPSRTTREGHSFDDRGPHVLKGVPGDWRLFAVASI